MFPFTRVLKRIIEVRVLSHFETRVTYVSYSRQPFFAARSASLQLGRHIL